MSASPTDEQLDERAAELLGLGALRDGQADAVRAVLEGRDCLVVMATGYGKSAIYQLAGLERTGPTIVVSPLLALQRDQADDLVEHGVATLDGATPRAERERVLQGLRSGELAFVLLSPEQLAAPGLLEELAAAEPGLLVVDEAHCVSEWGHDFRPEYLRLGAAARSLGRPPVLALTATAATPVRREIATRLGMEDPVEVVRGLDRREIHLAVEPHADEDAKRERLAALLDELDGDGIVYVATRAQADEIGELLPGAAAYHAGLARGARDEVQAAFLEGDLRVVVATTAFGMGIDKPDVRFVVHHDPPASLDALMQEVGRAGRDGEGARAVMLYHDDDLGLRGYQAGVARLEAEEVAGVAGCLGDDARDLDDLEDCTGVGRGRVLATVQRLEELGACEVLPTGGARATGEAPDDVVERVLELQEQRRQAERARVEMVRQYAQEDGCRRALLLGAFGVRVEPPCGACDTCDAGDGLVNHAGEHDGDLPAGTRVVHERFGAGEVQRVEDDRLRVLFDDTGHKAIGREHAEDVLEPEA